MNPTHRRFAIAAAALLAATVWVGADDAPAEDPTAPRPWRALAASGQVEALPHAGDFWHDVSRGTELAARTQVRTGKRGRATLNRNDDVMIVEPFSRVVLPEGLAGESTRVEQSSGSVLYEVEHLDEGSFEVVTPYLVAGVKGTAFLVSVTDRYAAVTVRDGGVEVFRPEFDDRVELRPGDTALVDYEDAGRLQVVQEHGRDSRSKTGRMADTELRKVRRVSDRGEDLKTSLNDADLIDTTVRTAEVDLIDSEVKRGDNLDPDAETKEEELKQDQVDQDRTQNRRTTNRADPTQADPVNN